MSRNETTEFKLLGGTGINCRWRVLRNGRGVALIERNGNHGWEVLSHYRRRIEYAHTSALAKLQCAHRSNFPTKQEVYNVICAETEARRRAFLDERSRVEMFELTRAMIAGSNSARDAIAELLTEIEALAKDRTRSTATPASTPHPGGSRGDAAVEAWYGPQQEQFRGEPVPALLGYPAMPGEDIRDAT